ncbi:hypothetical protein ABT063_09975 [Streptomyces sp. NPDC002838]|uniref:hypothetical protein n=1 Tax=Streptomyces sp. NPDC002838 TaxID=3154436 RepID=UPI00332E4510
MTEEGPRLRVRRWVVAVWAVAVAVGGGFTLLLRESAEPPTPYGRQEATPTPSLPEGWESMCPSPTPDEDGSTAVLCLFRTR